MGPSLHVLFQSVGKRVMATAEATRVCSKCGEDKPYAGVKGWHRRQCPDCRRAHRRKDKWEYKQSPEYRTYHRRYSREYAQTSQGQRAIQRTRANRRSVAGKAVCTHGSQCAPSRAMLALAQGHRCYWCAKPFNSIRRPTLEHIVPLVKGGLHCRENVAAACSPCNSRKYDTDPLEFARRNGRLL